jgi:hypothetical protein
MNINTDIINNIKEIKNEIIELNNMIDNKCIDIYNQNEENENKILKYKLYLENIILEHHKICKVIFARKNI